MTIIIIYIIIDLYTLYYLFIPNITILDYSLQLIASLQGCVEQYPLVRFSL